MRCDWTEFTVTDLHSVSWPLVLSGKIVCRLCVLETHNKTLFNLSIILITLSQSQFSLLVWRKLYLWNMVFTEFLNSFKLLYVLSVSHDSQAPSSSLFNYVRKHASTQMRTNTFHVHFLEIHKRNVAERTDLLSVKLPFSQCSPISQLILLK